MSNPGLREAIFVSLFYSYNFRLQTKLCHSIQLYLFYISVIVKHLAAEDVMDMSELSIFFRSRHYIFIKFHILVHTYLIVMTILKELSISMKSVLETFFGSDTDVMSNRVKDIMANPEDRKSYLEALERLKKLEDEGKQGTETVKLSNNEELELTT